MMSITRTRLCTISNRKSTVEVTPFSPSFLVYSSQSKGLIASCIVRSHNPAIPGDPIGP